MRMKTPPHPGRIVKQECLEPLHLTVTKGARLLGVNRNTFDTRLRSLRIRLRATLEGAGVI